MNTGKIQYAIQMPTFILKFSGDVRLTLCNELSTAIHKALNTQPFTSILVDLTEAISLASTTLGLLAKLSILSQQQLGIFPTIVSTNPDISHLLDSMGFNQVFNLVHTQQPCPECLNDLPAQPLSEATVKARVLEAHQILMGLNEENRQSFYSLVEYLQDQTPHN